MASQSEIYRSLVVKSSQIIKEFKFLYGAIVGLLIIGAYYIVGAGAIGEVFRFDIGPWLGRIALALLGIVVLPGILGRFKIEIPITRIITLFRRQLGITVFLLALTHYEFVRGIPLLSGQIPFKLPFPLFETVSFYALMIMFFMFLTSNNPSIKKLGKWWKRLHRLIYLAVWLLVLHTGLQRISIWSVLILIVTTLELLSWIIFFLKKPTAKV